jgi:radical SAM superfamily enzyme YgiQ (UPF0313 family)
MKITLLDVLPDKGKLNRDFAGRFGTGYSVGDTLFSRFLEYVRSVKESLPYMHFGYAASILKENGHEIEYKINEIPESDLVILASSLICNKKEVSYIKRIKKETDAKVGVIGKLASVIPSIYSDADFIIIGEPEHALLNIKDEIPTGNIVSDEMGNMDELPFPDWDPFPYKKFSYFPVLKRKPIFFMETSRGCPHLCIYCPYTVKCGYRVREVEKVVDEIEYLVSKYPVKGIVFRDPMFSMNKKRTKRLANEIVKRGVKVNLVCETRLDRLDEETLDALKEAGLKAVEVGIESANVDILKKASRKPAEIEHQERIVNYCRKIGVNVIAFYILGFPDDNEKTILRTIEYAKKRDTFAAQFTIFTPYPGTEIYDKMKEKIDEDLDKFDAFTPVFKHDNLSKEKLLELKSKAYKSYYSQPGYILRWLKWYLGGKY